MALSQQHRQLPEQYARNIGGGPGPTPTPWYEYPRIDNYGSPDPFGGFPKPDSNFMLPANTPITALAPGTVSAVDNPAWGGAVTMQMDTPYNSIATHEAYIHLQKSSVSPGQHLNAGDVLGYGGANITSGQEPAGVGFAFYNGSDYGYGPTWSKYVGTPPLNPVPYLNGVAQNGPGGQPPGGPGSWCTMFPFLPGCPGAGTSGPNLFDPCTWPILQWFCPGSTVNWQDIGIRILLVVLGAILVIVGFSKLFGSPTIGIPQPAQKQGEADEGEGEAETSAKAAPKNASGGPETALESGGADAAIVAA